MGFKTGTSEPPKSITAIMPGVVGVTLKEL